MKPIFFLLILSQVAVFQSAFAADPYAVELMDRLRGMVPKMDVVFEANPSPMDSQDACRGIRLVALPDRPDGFVLQLRDSVTRTWHQVPIHSDTEVDKRPRDDDSYYVRVALGNGEPEQVAVRFLKNQTIQLEQPTSTSPHKINTFCSTRVVTPHRVRTDFSMKCSTVDEKEPFVFQFSPEGSTVEVTTGNPELESGTYFIRHAYDLQTSFERIFSIYDRSFFYWDSGRYSQVHLSSRGGHGRWFGTVTLRGLNDWPLARKVECFVTN